MDFLLCSSCSADGGGGIGGNAWRPRVPSFWNGCMLCSLSSGEFAVLVTPELLLDEEE